MSTQEKLVDIINGFTENENLVESSWCDEHKDGLHGRLEVGQQHYIIKQLTQLIDSAKREGYEQGYIECGMKWNKVAEEVLSSMKETREHIEKTNAQIEQSEESK